MVLAIVPAAPPTRKNRRATSCPAPISAKVPYLVASRLIWRAFSSVPISISGSIQFLLRRFSVAANTGKRRAEDCPPYQILEGRARHSEIGRASCRERDEMSG